jgi:hypothetical protein
LSDAIELPLADCSGAIFQNVGERRIEPDTSRQVEARILMATVRSNRVSRAR